MATSHPRHRAQALLSSAEPTIHDDVAADARFGKLMVAVYWAISTMTTVGFGDLMPKTDVGRAMSRLRCLRCRRACR